MRGAASANPGLHLSLTSLRCWLGPRYADTATCWLQTCPEPFGRPRDPRMLTSHFPGMPTRRVRRALTSLILTLGWKQGDRRGKACVPIAISAWLGSPGKAKKRVTAFSGGGCGFVTAISSSEAGSPVCYLTVPRNISKNTSPCPRGLFVKITL